MSYRIFNKIKAKMLGYFWLPCPLCGRYFGGHEWKDGNEYLLMDTDGNGGTGICSDCGDKRKK